jgi:hypothetical protein
MSDATPSLCEFRVPKDAPTKTKWIEMPNGTGHWASNWELQQEAKRACIVNPKTGKPYTRHLYAQKNLRVEQYMTMRDGSSAPVRYAYELVCQRDGCDFKQKCGY